jgi:hypothetical protein
MYLTFRAVELALGNTPEEAIQIALEKRFRSKGILKDGKVINYDDRFEYGEDMLESGKWGSEVTYKIGKAVKIKGSRGKDWVDVLQSNEILKGVERLRSGDIVFFVTKPEKRKVGEIIGHIGIIKVEKNGKETGMEKVFLIHAGGTKGKGGMVKKVLLKDYISHMPFIGVKITRLDGFKSN